MPAAGMRLLWMAKPAFGCWSHGRRDKDVDMSEVRAHF